jgi:hypothetical protein
MDGVQPCILLVRDLASRKLLLSLPTEAKDARSASVALVSVFLEAGGPPAVEADNDWAFAPRRWALCFPPWGTASLLSSLRDPVLRWFVRGWYWVAEDTSTPSGCASWLVPGVERPPCEGCERPGEPACALMSPVSHRRHCLEPVRGGQPRGGPRLRPSRPPLRTPGLAGATPRRPAPARRPDAGGRRPHRYHTCPRRGWVPFCQEEADQFTPSVP